MRNKGLRGAAAAVIAVIAMVVSTVAVAPANAADSTCIASDQKSFDGCIEGGDSNIEVSSTIKFNTDDDLADLGIGSDTNQGYKEPAHYALKHSVTIRGIGSSAILRNVTFDVPSNITLTLGGTIVVDDVNLAGISLLKLVGINLGSFTLKNYDGISEAIKVSGGTLNLEDTAHVASGTNGAQKQQRAIAVTSNGSTVNLNSSGEYKRSVQSGIDLQINLESIPVVGILVKGLNAILGVLKINRNVDYPTVWGRDAAVYSEPGVNNATINISNGTYSNQKDSAALGKTYLNGAVSSSATVNIIGTGNVKISNTKIGNGVDSKHNGSSTTGTLNINNPYAQLDPAVETDEDAYKAATDSWALELRGGAKVNLVAGHINDTHSQHDTKKIIESESTARINILPTEKGEATIANRQYWIDQTKADKAGFSATVNPDAHVSGSAGVANDTTENDYQLWHSAATKKDDTLAQLQELVAKETSGSDPKAAPLSTSTYTKGTISASYPDVLGQAIYGREVISSGSKIGADTIFDAVNSGTAGTVVLYGQPWTDAYNPTDVPTQGDDLFAGWYTSQTKFGEEDAIQAKPYENAADSVNNPKHHKWDPTKDGFNGTYNDTIVVDTAKYSGTLYAHFVSKDTMAVKNYQTSAATNGKSDYVNVRLIAGVDSYNFSNALFTVTLDGKLLGTAKTTTAFDYITANGAKKTVEKSPYKGTDGYEADISQGDARYVTTAIVKNVKVGSKLAVTPKWTTLDGTVVTGEQVTFTVTADDAD